MSTVKVTIEVTKEIARRLADGSLKLDGVILRDAKGKIRYILKGFEKISNDPSLQHLQSAISATQMLQVVAIAQNLSIAASLQRIEGKLKDIEDRLSNIESRLSRIETKQTLIIEALRASPVNKLKSAANSANIALKEKDKSALIGAAREAEHAARDIIAQLKHLFKISEDGRPIALRMPNEIKDLAASAADAFEIVSSILVSLNRSDLAGKLLGEAVAIFDGAREILANYFSNPDLLLKRLKASESNDDELISAGHEIQKARHRCLGRQQFIELGIIHADEMQTEFEVVDHSEEVSIIEILNARTD